MLWPEPEGSHSVVTRLCSWSSEQNKTRRGKGDAQAAGLRLVEQESLRWSDKLATRQQVKRIKESVSEREMRFRWLKNKIGRKQEWLTRWVIESLSCESLAEDHVEQKFKVPNWVFKSPLSILNFDRGKPIHHTNKQSIACLLFATFCPKPFCYASHAKYLKFGF